MERACRQGQLVWRGPLGAYGISQAAEIADIESLTILAARWEREKGIFSYGIKDSAS